MVATLPGNLKFENLGKKPGILTCSVVKFRLTQKIYHINKKILSSLIFFY